MIHCFTPYHPDGLGHAYNSACALVRAPSDWIVLMDADVMMLPGTWGTHLALALERHPQFDAYVCMATRTWERGDQQLRDPSGIRDCRDLIALYGAVAARERSHHGEVIPWPADRSPSGFFMCFRRRLWSEFPFPLLGIQGKPRIGIETAWFRTIRAAGKTVGLLTGLVAIHFYRLDRPDESIGYLNAP